MKQLRLAPIGIFALAVIIAVIIACSSDDQGQQQSTAEDQQQSEAAEQTQSTASTGTVQDEQQESTSTTSTDSDGQSDETVEQTSGAQQQSTVSVTNQQQQDEQSQQPGERQAEPQEQKQAQTEDTQAEPSDQQQAEQAQEEQSEPAEVEEEEMTPEDEDQSAQVEQQEEQEEQQSSDAAEAERLRLRAEEISANATITDIVGLNAWLNGAETTIALELAKGNVVLIDFWTYTCINCVRTLPFLTAWDEKYRDHGLVIIGVHTPEFEFEERIDNVRAALAEHDIEYLVAIDNDYRTWRAFRNRWWPRKFLIGPTDDGSPMGVRYDHIGEGDYEETEHEIREALTAVGKDISDIPFGVEVAVPTREGGTPRQTRELYAGWRRNVGSGGPYAGQDAYFLAGIGVDTLYNDIPTNQRQHNFWYLEGLWRTEEESIVHARQTDELEDYMAMLVRGRTANVVLTVAEDGQPFNVYVELDGRWLFPNEAGSHVQWDDEGRSFIRVTENDLYRLLFLPEWSEHELKLSSNSDQFRIFAFTFGSYVGGE